MSELSDKEIELYREYQRLMTGINDLADLLCDEDRGAPYAQLLAEQAKVFFTKLIALKA